MMLTFKNIYITTAIMSAVIYVVPFMAVIGVVLFPIGIMLALAPAALMYLSLWWLLKTGLSALFQHPKILKRVRRPDLWVNWLPVAVLAIAAIAVPYVANLEAYKLIAALQQGDVESKGPIRIQDTVTLEQPISVLWRSEDDVPCIWICQRLLQDGMARIVRVDINGVPGLRSKTKSPFAPVAFTLEDRIPCPRIPLDSLGFVQMHSDPALCIVRTDAPIQRGLTISLQNIKAAKVNGWGKPWNLAPDTISARRITIFDGDGQLLFRRTKVTATPLIVPLLTDAAAGILTTVTYVGWARTKIISGGIDNGPLGYGVLPKVLGLPEKPMQRPVLGE